MIRCLVNETIDPVTQCIILKIVRFLHIIQSTQAGAPLQTWFFFHIPAHLVFITLPAWMWLFRKTSQLTECKATIDFPQRQHSEILAPAQNLDGDHSEYYGFLCKHVPFDP